MYEIRLEDGTPVYYQGDADYTAYDIECTTAKGDAGSLQFTLPTKNPMCGKLATRQSVLRFLLDGEEIGRYEVREIVHGRDYSEDVYAVGELAWLYDSVQPQAEYHGMTVRGFLETLLAIHNEQCPEHAFAVGIVDVEDSNDSLYRFTNHESTLADIRDKLVDRLGGQIKLRRQGGTRYIDYLTDATYGAVSTQRIYFGENMLDYSDTLTVDGICSEVIPLGCQLENSADNSQIGNLTKRLGIEDVNGGADWIANDALVARFGHIRTTKVWDDVTIASNLLDKARAWLASDQFEQMHLTVRAVDLSLTSRQFGRLRMGDSVQVVAKPYGLNRRFAITKRTYHPTDPSADTLEIGDDVSVSFIASQVNANRSMATTQVETRYVQSQWLAEAIENVTAMMTGARGGYKVTEYDDDGRWLADYYMDTDSKETARIVHMVNMAGDAYSTNGIDGPFETAILANGTILGKYLQAHSVQAEAISAEYTSMWEDADAATLNTARTEFKAADAEISARVAQVETDAKGLKTDLAAEIKVRADQISQTVKRGQINSAIEQTAETIYIKAGKFGWESQYSSMTTAGKLYATGATFDNCNVNGYVAAEQNNKRVVVNQGSIQFYTRKSSSSAYKKGAELVGTYNSSTGDPGFVLQIASDYSAQIGGNKSVVEMRAESNSNQATVRASSTGVYLQDWNKVSGTGEQRSMISLTRAAIQARASRIDLYGDVYVNGTKIG